MPVMTRALAQLRRRMLEMDGILTVALIAVAALLLNVDVGLALILVAVGLYVLEGLSRPAGPGDKPH